MLTKCPSKIADQAIFEILLCLLMVVLQIKVILARDFAVLGYTAIGATIGLYIKFVDLCFEKLEDARGIGLIVKYISSQAIERPILFV